MSNPYITFNKTILFTVEMYLSRALAEGTTREDFHRKIVSGIRSYQTMGRFSSVEAAKVSAVGEHEYMKKLKEIEISYVVYALELIKLWVTHVPEKYRKNIYLGVSSKKLLKGRATFAVAMLDLKRRDSKKYEELKNIIDQSVITAKNYYFYLEEHLVSKSDT